MHMHCIMNQILHCVATCNIDSFSFVYFFFFLGVIQKPISKEDEIQNIQLVIDILSRDILHTSLAHITGREVVDGNRESIWNLLEIFGGLLEYILNKIDSDASTDGKTHVR